MQGCLWGGWVAEHEFHSHIGLRTWNLKPSWTKSKRLETHWGISRVQRNHFKREGNTSRLRANWRVSQVQDDCEHDRGDLLMFHQKKKPYPMERKMMWRSFHRWHCFKKEWMIVRKEGEERGRRGKEESIIHWMKLDLNVTLYLKINSNKRLKCKTFLTLIWLMTFLLNVTLTHQ